MTGWSRATLWPCTLTSDSPTKKKVKCSFCYELQGASPARAAPQLAQLQKLWGGNVLCSQMRIQAQICHSLCNPGQVALPL